MGDKTKKIENLLNIFCISFLLYSKIKFINFYEIKSKFSSTNKNFMGG
mgnify:CR=1 FL=1